jgi:hypothetical protein
MDVNLVSKIFQSVVYRKTGDRPGNDMSNKNLPDELSRKKNSDVWNRGTQYFSDVDFFDSGFCRIHSEPEQAQRGLYSLNSVIAVTVPELGWVLEFWWISG